MGVTPRLIPGGIEFRHIDDGNTIVEKFKWVGAIKLGLSDNSDFVPSSTWTKLVVTAIILLAIPALWERVANRAMETAPEVAQAMSEEE